MAMKQDEVAMKATVDDATTEPAVDSGAANATLMPAGGEETSPNCPARRVTFFSSLFSKAMGSERSVDEEAQGSSNVAFDAALKEEQQQTLADVQKEQEAPALAVTQNRQSVSIGESKDQKQNSKQSSAQSNKSLSGSQQDLRRSMDFVEEQVLQCVYKQIPERVLFAKGCGAFSYFEVKSDVLKKWSVEGHLFGKQGKHISTFVRFSSWNGLSGSAESVRDLRGFSVRFYTDEGNFDLVGTNLPVFFIRTPALFPSLVRSLKRNPVTNLRDPNAMWNFFAINPESVHALMMLFSDRGLPNNYRCMNGYGCHAYKLVNSQGEFVYVKFSWKARLEFEALSQKDADRLAAMEPDYFSRDLYMAVSSGSPPVWDLYVQIMTLEQAKKLPFNPFDATKVWPQKAFPLQLVGTLTLNHNPTDFFADVEQIAFNPGNLVPGIEPSPDPMFQQRLSLYPKAALYRIGRNYQQLTVNKESEICRMRGLGHAGGFVGLSTHYSDEQEPSSFQLMDHNNLFDQAKQFWCNVLDNDGRRHLCANIAADLKDAEEGTKSRMVEIFSAVHLNFGKTVLSELERWKAYETGDFSSLFYQGIESISHSTPNLMSMNEVLDGSKKHKKAATDNNPDISCKKLRENCKIQ